MPRRRRLLLALAALALAASAAASAARPSLHFPRDHYGHPTSAIEWWYSTALVKDGAGTPYLVFYALFSAGGGLVSSSQVTNLHTGRIVGHSEQPSFETVGTSSLDVHAGPTRLEYAPAANTWNLAAGGTGYGIALRERPAKPYALHGGGTGIIRQSLGGASDYYSATRMAAAGTLRIAGKAVAVHGESWLDHQWGSFADDPRAFNWDWFSCRFDDGSALMLYQFRDRTTGVPLDRFKSGTWVPAHGAPREVTTFGATHGPRVLRAAGRAWPLDWRLAVPSLHLAESVHALFPDQLVHGSILPTFWEGASSATGSRPGTCVVELSYR